MQEKNIVNRYRQLIIVNLKPTLLRVCLTHGLILGYALVSKEYEVDSIIPLV